ncbi:hypothetical protein PRUPE_6G348900 [Prunus persica]|uniref:Uncharacterized protein n=1 Tax=Prunus persica TaxID=3760 RepID=A0A251P024_PRUPE|nr:hypothetical protein PRUPE_6G348900 [Prunus persica]
MGQNESPNLGQLMKEPVTCLYLKSTPKSLLSLLFSSLTTARATMDMIIGTDKEGYVELFVKWYEDIEILQMVKKRVVKAISTMDIDNVNNGIADTPKQKLKWYRIQKSSKYLRRCLALHCTKTSCLTPPRSSVAALIFKKMSSPFLRFSL